MWCSWNDLQGGGLAESSRELPLSVPRRKQPLWIFLLSYQNSYQHNEEIYYWQYTRCSPVPLFWSNSIFQLRPSEMANSPDLQTHKKHSQDGYRGLFCSPANLCTQFSTKEKWINYFLKLHWRTKLSVKYLAKMEAGKVLSAPRYDSHENSLNRHELHFNSLHLCIYISKYLCIYEKFAVYETTKFQKGNSKLLPWKAGVCPWYKQRSVSQISYLLNFSACHRATSVYNKDDIFGKHWHFLGCKVMHEIPIENLKYQR